MVRIVRRETRRRGFLGWIFLLLFLAFNALMATWTIGYWAAIAPMTAGGDAAATGAAIGATVGTGLILFIWATGAVILGVFVLISRGRKIIVEETVTE